MRGAQKNLRSRVKGTSVHKCTFVLTHFHQYSRVLEISVPVHQCTNVPIYSCPSVPSYLKTGYTNGRTCKNTTEVGGRKRDGEREREREGERWHKGTEVPGVRYKSTYVYLHTPPVQSCTQAACASTKVYLRTNTLVSKCTYVPKKRVHEPTDVYTCTYTHPPVQSCTRVV